MKKRGARLTAEQRLIERHKAVLKQRLEKLSIDAGEIRDAIRSVLEEYSDLLSDCDEAATLLEDAARVFSRSV